MLVDLKRIGDERGFFARAFSAREFEEHGLATTYQEMNFSTSAAKGTIRGLHYQNAPHQEAKFVRCMRGALFDVVIDLRPQSPTYLRWAGFEITAASYRGIHVPTGCAHGVQTLEDHTEMLYMASACYYGPSEVGIRWDDPLFGIEWPDVGQRIVSEKDQSWPDHQPV